MAKIREPASSTVTALEFQLVVANRQALAMISSILSQVYCGLTYAIVRERWPDYPAYPTQASKHQDWVAGLARRAKPWAFGNHPATWNASDFRAIGWPASKASRDREWKDWWVFPQCWWCRVYSMRTSCSWFDHEWVFLSCQGNSSLEVQGGLI